MSLVEGPAAAASQSTPNTQLLEGLWGLGYTEQMLRGIDVGGSIDDLKKRLLAMGISQGEIDRAQSSVAWRPDDTKTLGENILTYMRDVLKLPSEQTAGIEEQLVTSQGQHLDESVVQALRGTVPVQAFTNIMIKVGQGANLPALNAADPTVIPWNPMRGDAPVSSPVVTKSLGGVQPDASASTTSTTTTTGAGAGTTTGVKPPAIQLTDWAGKPLPKSPADILNYIRQNYGFAAMALNIPDINNTLDMAARQGLGPDAVKGLISATTWWKTHDDAARQWMDLQQNDPGTALRRRTDAINALQRLVITNGEGTIDERRLEQIADLSLAHGWSTGETAAALASEYHYDPTGQMAGLSLQMKNQARNYLVPMSDAAYTQWGQKILAGTASIDQFNQYLQTQAKSMLPGIAAQLDQGFDVRTLIDPYVQRAAQLLDMSPTDINFTDSKWIRFLNQTDVKGNKVPASLFDMETTIKTDPIYGWDKTKGAHEEAAQMSSSILSKFGRA